jgi:hypothetical protein
MTKCTWLATVVASVVGSIATAGTAGAWGWDPSRAPEQPVHERVINHFVYKPRYTHVYHRAPHGDPYTYRYVQRSYYPYHASGYWVHADAMRNRYRYHYHGPKYQYHPSWGAKAEHGHGHQAPRLVK